MAVSTSRATGKVTASLVVTAACLPQRLAPPQPPPRNQASSRPDRRSRHLSSAGATVIPGRLKDSNAENQIPGAQAVRAAGVGAGSTTVKSAVDRIGSEKQSDAPQSGTSTGGEGRGAEAAAETAVAGADGEAGSDGVQHSMPTRCRERSSGKLRGGDLM